MKVLRNLAWVFILLATPIIVLAEKIDDAYLIKHLQTKQYGLDPQAAAVVLYEKATVTISRGTNRINTAYKVYRVIRLLKQSALDEANIFYGYYGTKSFSASVAGVRGNTYTLANGKLVKTPLQKEAIFNKQIDEYHSELRFTMPAVQPGCIIEYSYEMQSPLDLDLPSWVFQSEYPTLKSQYEMNATNKLRYTFVTQGMPPSKAYSSIEKAEASGDSCYVATEAGFDDGTTNIWSRSNVPPLKHEPYISSLKNHEERLDIQLSGIDNGDYFSGNIYNTWERANRELWEDEQYGMVLRKNNRFLTKTVDSLVGNVTDPLIKAKNIFAYVRGNFYCDDTISMYPGNSIESVFKTKTGNAAALNFLLTAMLKKAGLRSSPVILGTLGQLKVIELYPIMERFIHTVSTVVIENKRYMLDASDKYNTFGILPLHCYNGYARAIDKEGEGFYLEPADVNERNVITVSISALSDTGCNMNITEMYGKNKARLLRRMWNEDKRSISAYTHERAGTFADNGHLVETSVANLNDPDTSLTLKYTVHQNFDKPVTKLYLPTDIFKAFNTTPFSAMKRRLPVELPHQIEFIYALSIKLPGHIEIDDVPKGGIVTYGDAGMTFRHLVSYDSTLRYLTVLSKFVTSQINYQASEYETLRKFFDKMLAEQNTTMTLKFAKP